MPNSKALASVGLAVLSLCVWPLAPVAGVALAVISIGLAALAFRSGSRRLALASVGITAGAALVFLMAVPAIQSIREASRRTDGL